MPRRELSLSEVAKIGVTDEYTDALIYEKLAQRTSNASFAEALRERVASLDFGSLAGELPVRISIGVAGLTPSRQTADDVLRAADSAMYTAKRLGRNRVCVAPSTD